MRLFITLLLLLTGTICYAANSAVIIMYHRFGDDRYPTTSINLDQFDQQLAYLKTAGYQVLPLPEIVDALQHNKSLPDKTVGIAIDDGFATVYAEAWPRFKKYNFPFTLFVATDPIGSTDMMSWDQVRELAKSPLVTIGNHTATHPYLERLSMEQVQTEIVTAQQRLIKELGITPTLFAYPYGEYDTAVMNEVKKFGFVAAFGQISGAIGPNSNMFVLSRFPLNENYGKLDRFKQIINSQALAISKLSPADPMIAGDNPPTIHFTVQDPTLNLSKLTCYATNVGPLTIKLVGKQQVQITSPEKFSKGRTHVNCTLPAGQGRYYWLGILYIV